MRSTPSRPPSNGNLFGMTLPASASSISISSALGSSTSSSNSNNVQVALRIRPPLSPEQSSNVPARFQKTVVLPTPGSTNSLSIETASIPGHHATSNKQHFSFDRVFGPEEGQPDVFTVAEPLVDRFIEGRNVTILAYGQTSSGKSYSMGTDHLSPEEVEMGNDRAGIIPRAVSEIFERLNKLSRESNGQYTFQLRNSYIELYNEDLIDLLASDTGDRPQVTIREDKGHIIWSGLREAKVASPAEVMSNLEAGSSLRQTNATDMNSQSSRSHAIFSLTLTQKKQTGNSGTALPSMPSSPSMSRFSSTGARSSIASPSGLPRVSSPVPTSRSATPVDRPASRIGALKTGTGIASGRMSPSISIAEDIHTSSEGEWVTVTSKWHFVDLAGSERLKRTSAMGERVKEGISINSGLHALGNVISALGDPARARQTTHIPYRDSKLTRLLQDSLGGNALTLMIACISPTEFNANESLNTLKYANRARNIKNTSTINEIEVGWDDLEHVQNLVVKLRAELARLRAGEAANLELPTGSNSKVLQLQEDFTALSQKYAKLTAEAAKQGLPPRSDSPSPGARSPRASFSPSEFAAAVEPVVEEYEKSLSAIESQLALTRAALLHTEDVLRDSEMSLSEEKMQAEVNANEILELKNRIAKLNEREAVADTYVRTLEERIKTSEEGGDVHVETINDLKKEILRLKENEGKSEDYIKNLEARLEASNGDLLHLRNQVDNLEKDLHRREQAYHELEERLTLLDTSTEHQALLKELEQRDQRVLTLQTEIDALQLSRDDLQRDGDRFQELLEVEQQSKATLQERITQLEDEIASAKTEDRRNTLHHTRSGSKGSIKSVKSDINRENSAQVDRLIELEIQYKQAMQELDSVNARYKESLIKLEEVSQELREVKLARDEEQDVLISAPPSPNPNLTQSSPVRSLLQPSGSREDLRSTGTIPISPTRNRRSLPIGSNRPFFGRAATATTDSKDQSHSRSVSLSQELLLVQGSPGSQLLPSPNRSHSPNPSRDSLSGAFPLHRERSYDSLAKEIAQLQTVLASREAEISQLEGQLQTLTSTGRLQHSASSSVPSSPGSQSHEYETSSNDTSLSPLEATLRRSLTPSTFERFAVLKDHIKEAEDALQSSGTTKLEDLMRSMAKKEATHKDTVEDLNGALESLRKQHDALQTLSRDQVLNMSSEIEQLKSQLADFENKDQQTIQRLIRMEEELAAKQAELEKHQIQAEQNLASALADLKALHKEELERKDKQTAKQLAAVQTEHATILRKMMDERENIFVRRASDQDSVTASLKADHRAELEQQARAQARKLEQMENNHQLVVERQASELREMEARLAILSEDSSKEWRSLAAELNAQHDSTMKARELEFNRELEQLARAQSAAREKMEADQSRKWAQLKEDHEAVLASGLQEYANRIETMNQESEVYRAELVASHQSAIKEQASTFEESTRAAEARYKQQIDGLQNRLEEVQGKQSEELRNRTATEQKTVQYVAQVAALNEQIAALNMQLQKDKQEVEIETQKRAAEMEAALAENEAILQEAMGELQKRHASNLEAQMAAASRKHAEEISILSAQHNSHALELQRQHESSLADYQSKQQSRSAESEAQKTAEIAKLALALREAQLAAEASQKAALDTARERDEARRALSNASASSASASEAASLKLMLHDVRDQLSRANASRSDLEAELIKQKNLVKALESRPTSSHMRPTDSGFGEESADTARSASPTVHSPSLSRLRASSSVNKPMPVTPPPSEPLPLPPLPGASSSKALPAVERIRDSTSSQGTHASHPSVDPSRASMSSMQTSDTAHLPRGDEHEQISQLAKKLAQSESDLRANVDLVGTLENALNDTERILRKARMQMNDLVKERDAHERDNSALKKQLQDRKNEMETMKQNLTVARRESETRLNAERQQRDAARVELEARLDAMRQKKSKFSCM